MSAVNELNFSVLDARDLSFYEIFTEGSEILFHNQYIIKKNKFEVVSLLCHHLLQGDSRVRGKNLLSCRERIGAKEGKQHICRHSVRVAAGKISILPTSAQAVEA